MRHLCALFVCLILALPTARAETITSAYTDFDLRACQTISQNEEEGGSYEGRCPGFGGIPVIFMEGDLRQFVAFGENGAKTCAAAQTFGHFNHVGGKIEWRLEGAKPFATIQRWFETDEETKRQWLVVTRLGEPQCHVAYVDARRPNANEEARRKADELARDFNCKNDAIAVVADPPAEAGQVAIGAGCPDANLRR